MSRRAACHKSRSRRLFPVTACFMRSLRISLKRHSQTNESGPQRNKHVHRLVPPTPSCPGYMCHRLPPAARSTPASAPAHALLPPMPRRSAIWPPPVLIGNRPHVTCPAPPPSPQRHATPEGASLSTSRLRHHASRLSAICAAACCAPKRQHLHVSVSLQPPASSPCTIAHLFRRFGPWPRSDQTSRRRHRGSAIAHSTSFTSAASSSLMRTRPCAQAPWLLHAHSCRCAAAPAV